MGSTSLFYSNHSSRYSAFLKYGLGQYCAGFDPIESIPVRTQQELYQPPNETITPTLFKHICQSARALIYFFPLVVNKSWSIQALLLCFLSADCLVTTVRATRRQYSIGNGGVRTKAAIDDVDDLIDLVTEIIVVLS